MIRNLGRFARQNQGVRGISGTIDLYHFAEEACEDHLAFHIFKTVLRARRIKSENYKSIVRIEHSFLHIFRAFD